MSEESFRSRRERHSRSKQNDDVVDQISPPSDDMDRSPHLSNFQKKPKMSLLFYIISAFLIISSGLIGYTIGSQQKKEIPAKNSSKKEVISKKSDQTKDDEWKKVSNPTTGEVWLDEPLAMQSQGFVVADDVSTVDYYEVGKRDGNTIILAVLHWYDKDTTALFEKKDDLVYYISKPSSTVEYTEENTTTIDNFSSNLTENSTTHYDSLSYPKTINTKDGNKTFPKNTVIGDRTSDAVGEVIQNYGKSKFIKNGDNYFLRTPIGTQIALQ